VIAFDLWRRFGRDEVEAPAHSTNRLPCGQDILYTFFKEIKMNKKKNPKLRQFNVRVSRDEFDRLRSDADERDLSISAYVRIILKFTMYPETVNNIS
jgi:hypothetical protein